MKSIIVLGNGMVGSAIAIELSKKYHVTVADKNTQSLHKSETKCEALNVIHLDVTDEVKLKLAIKKFDLVVCAVPGFLGFAALKKIIESGKNVVDISFFPEFSLELNELAKKHGVTAIVDCGIAPGLDNMILGYHATKMEVQNFECMVGGLPKNPKWPFKYRAPFSPVDVIEEYTRPARMVEHGKVVVKEPLSECIIHDFEGVGKLESFNSDGLERSFIPFPTFRI